MHDVRRAKVIGDRKQEGLILRELGDAPLRLLVEIVVAPELGQERLDLPLLRESGHAKEESSGIVVLRDRLEPLEVLLAEGEHHIPNGGAP
jgi:hypothetical protein